MTNTAAKFTSVGATTAKLILEALQRSTLVTAVINDETYRSEFVKGDLDLVEDADEAVIVLEGGDSVLVRDLLEAQILEGNSFRAGGVVYTLFHETAVAIESKPVFVVVQRGGSSRELYVHEQPSREEALAFRESAARAAYETSPPIEVPAALASSEGFYDVLEGIVHGMAEMSVYETGAES